MCISQSDIEGLKAIKEEPMCTSQAELEELRAIRQELADVKRQLKKKEEDTSYWATHPIDTGCGVGNHNPFSPI